MSPRLLFKATATRASSEVAYAVVPRLDGDVDGPVLVVFSRALNGREMIHAYADMNLGDDMEMRVGALPSTTATVTRRIPAGSRARIEDGRMRIRRPWRPWWGKP